MNALAEKYAKIFKLEAQLGYANRAVYGGMQKLAVTLLSDAREAALAETLISEVGAKLKNYEGLTADQRRQSLVEVGKLLGISGIEKLPAAAAAQQVPSSADLKIKEQEEKTSQVQPPKRRKPASKDRKSVV